MSALGELQLQRKKVEFESDGNGKHLTQKQSRASDTEAKLHPSNIYWGPIPSNFSTLFLCIYSAAQTIVSRDRRMPCIVYCIPSATHYNIQFVCTTQL